MTSIHAQLNSEPRASRGDAPATPASPRGRDQTARAGDPAEQSAFAGLLGSLSVPALPQVAEASPERMFDAASDTASGARSDRIGTMASEQRTADLSTTDPRQAIEARAESTSRAHPDSPTHAKANTDLQVPGRDVNSATSATRAGTEQSVARPESSAFESRAATMLSADRSVQAPIGRETAAGAQPIETSVRPIAAAPTVGVAASAIESRGADAKGTAAHQIGRALASGGASGTESARSIAQVAGDDRSPAPRDARNKSAGKPADGQQADKPKDVRPAELPERFRSLVKAIRFGSGAGESSSARFRLDPPELGQLLVDVRMDEGKLRVRLKTESQEALSRISHRMGELRSALELHGISIDQVEMEVDPKLADRGEDPLEFLSRQHDQPAAFAESHGRHPGAKETLENRGGAVSPAGDLRHEQSADESQYTEPRAERGLDVRA